MGDDKNGRRRAGNKLGDLGFSCCVQVIGRLIEDDKVWVIKNAAFNAMVTASPPDSVPMVRSSG